MIGLYIFSQVGDLMQVKNSSIMKHQASFNLLRDTYVEWSVYMSTTYF